MKKIKIAIDGYSSCGKSTLAKALAKKLKYIYVDSGAMYRSVTLFCLRRGFVAGNEIQKEAIIDALPEIQIQFKLNKQSNLPELYLNEENVEKEIRSLYVSNHVSLISAIKEVRGYLVDLQQKMGEKGGVVMDGRDIGSVVFPNAELKIFLTADPLVRAKRRYAELKAKGENSTLNEVIENINSRDLMDTTREESPLIQTADAIVIDNSELTEEDQLKLVFELVLKMND